MSVQNLLVELRVEELPPKALKKLGDAFAQEIWIQLRNQELITSDNLENSIKAFATPRRLGVWIKEVKSQAEVKYVQQKLMPVTVGIDADGKATPALIKKLQSLGVDPSELEDVVANLSQIQDGKTQGLIYSKQQEGVRLEEGLQKAIEQAIAKLPIPKVMQYQLHEDCDLPGWSTVSFVRPAHGLIALHADEVVNVTALGLKAGNTTLGHRFEAIKTPLTLAHADDYAQTLAVDGAVVVGFEDRSQALVQSLRAQAKKLNTRLEVEPAGMTDEQAEAFLLNNELVQEVTSLVERPTVMVCRFDEMFLQVPQECLILTMKANQKYFPLLDEKGNLSNRFLIVSNINPLDASAVIGGNERVVRPRLSDAKFFFDQDRKKTLESRVPGLDKVIYHNQLGTQGDRMLRVCAIGKSIAKTLLASGWVKWQNPESQLLHLTERAARLAKTDLLTDMVGEFPELQGTMGHYYALNDGEDAVVAEAIADHYKPRFAGDELPRNDVGLIVAMADKLETLVGMFGIGNLPTGDKDPFALRRHALGVTRILLEEKLPLSVSNLLDLALSVFDPKAVINFDKSKLEIFFQDRLIHFLQADNYPLNHIMSVLGADNLHNWSDIKSRLDAVADFSELPQSQALASANKRITNILKKSTESIETTVDPFLFKEVAEQYLFDQLNVVDIKVQTLYRNQDYTGSLQALAQLRDAVDAFFNDVMVNAEDTSLRLNRLGLLMQLHSLMNQVADISRLAH
jgi:glycyl-tRNA synthetase beta chain